MIEEFLQVLVDGKVSEDFESVQLDPDVEAGLDELQKAMDYGLYGLQAYAQVFSHWPAMARAYERLWTILESRSGHQSKPFEAFRNRFQHNIDFLRTRSLLRNEEWRENRDLAYANMYENAALGLGTGSAEEKLAARIAPPEGKDHAPEAAQLRAILSQRLFGTDSVDRPDLDRCIGILMDYLAIEQAIVRSVWSTQQSINQLLGRSPPKRPLDASTFDLYVQLQGDIERLPCLIHELEKEFSIHIVVTQDRIKFSERIVI